MPTDLFEKVNINKIAEELHLVEDAEEAAKQGLPSLDSTSLDKTETEIVGRIETYQSNAKDRGDRELAAYRKRLIDTNSKFRNHSIDSEIRNSKAQLKERVESAVTDLRGKQSLLKRAEDRLIHFQKENDLHRDASRHGKGYEVLGVGIIAVLFLIETLGNASFLAKGNELGLFGAYTEAIVISFANLGIAFLLGRLITNCHHVSWNRKSAGILAAIAFVAFAFFFNLMVAHYREITGTVLDEGGQLAMSAFRENPLGLKDFQSWMLFCMGFLFAIISFIDGIKWAGDPYPGYKKVFFRYQDEYETYKKVYDEHEEALERTFKEDSKKLNSIKQRLMGAEKERASILDGHRHVIKSYADYLNHLERAGNDLLKRYREVNRARRGGEAPARFNDKWEIEKQSPIDSTLPEDLLKREEIAAIIAETTASIDNGEKELQEEYDRVRADLRREAMHRLQTQTN